MAVLHLVVGPAANPLFVAIAERVHCSAVGAQTVSGDGFCRSVPLQRLLDEGKGSLLVAGLGDVTLQNLALLVDGTPQIMHLCADVGYAALRVTYISSGCHCQCLNPFIRDTRCLRISAANNGRNRFHQKHTVS